MRAFVRSCFQLEGSQLSEQRTECESVFAECGRDEPVREGPFEADPALDVGCEFLRLDGGGVEGGEQALETCPVVGRPELCGREVSQGVSPDCRRNIRCWQRLREGLAWSL